MKARQHRVEVEELLGITAQRDLENSVLPVAARADAVDQRLNDVLGERGDQPGECRADDDGDRQVDDVAPRAMNSLKPFNMRGNPSCKCTLRPEESHVSPAGGSEFSET